MIRKITNLLFMCRSKEAELTHKLEQAEREIEQLRKYKEFSESIFYYAGNYPAWKARLEFHDILREEVSTARINDFDGYLKRVEEGLFKLAELNTINETERETWLFARNETEAIAPFTIDLLTAATTKGG